MLSIARACRQAGLGPLSRPVIFLLEADEDQSHDDIRDALRDALKAEFPSGPGYYAWVVEVWDAEFIYEYETPTETTLFSRPYTVGDDGEVTFGDPAEVERLTTFVPVGESLREAKKTKKESMAETECIGQIIPLIETSIRPDGTVPIKLISPGWGSSAYYPADVLERDGPNVFCKGTHMNWDHQTETEALEQPAGELNDLAAVLEADAHWDPNHPKGPGLYADAKVFGPFDEKLNDLAPHIGTSINTSGVVEADEKGNIIEGEREGREGPILTELRKNKFTSVDFVTRAGAGGAVLQLFESARPKKKGDVPMPDNVELKEAQEKLAAAEIKVTELEAKEAEREADKAELDGFREAEVIRVAGETVAEALKDLDLHEVAKTRLVETLSKSPPMKEGELDKEALLVKTQEAATAEAAYFETLTGGGTVLGMGGGGEGEEGRKKLEESVRNAHPDFMDDQVRIYVTGR